MPSYVPPKKNTAYVFYVSLISQANTKIAHVNPTLVAGDVKVAVDDAAPANLATLPVVDADFTKRVKVSLSTAEMNGDNITVIFSDAAGAEWCDLTVNIQTTATQIDNLVRSTTPANSLDVNATGEAGIDLDNTSGTLAKTTDITGFNDITAAAAVNEWETQSQADPTGFHVNVLEMGGNSILGNLITLTLKQLDIQNNAGSALIAKSTGGDGHGIDADGNGSGEGISATGGTGGDGIGATGGSTSGHGINAAGGNSGAGINAAGSNVNAGIYAIGHGANSGILAVGGTDGDGLTAKGGGTTGSGFRGIAQADNHHGMELTKHGTGKDLDADEITTIDTVVDGIQTDLDNATDGLGALKTLIDAVPTASEIQTEMEENGASLLDTIRDDLDNGTDGLGAIKTAIDAIAASALLVAEIAAVTDQTHFTLATGSDIDDAYTNMGIVLYDDTNNDYPCVRKVADYVGATKTVTINSAPNFTLGADDSVLIFSVVPGGTAPTATEIVDEWETQSQADPTGFHVNVKEVNGTAQTAGDIPALVTTVDTVVDGIQTDLNNATDGLGALKTEIDANETKIDAIKAETALIVADTNELQTDDTPAALAAIDAKIDILDTVADGIQTDLDNGADGLGAIKTAVDAIAASALLTAEIDAVTDQTHFTLATGSDQDDAYTNMGVVLYDDSNSDYPCVRKVTDYVGVSKTVTIDTAPNFVLAADDSVLIFSVVPGGTAPTVGEIQAELEENGASLLDTIADRLSAVRAGYLDNLNGHTPQTGDSFARIGAPVGASISADLAAVKAETAAAAAWGSINSGTIFRGTVTADNPGVSFTIGGLAGQGAGAFVDANTPWYAYVFRDGGGAAAAPQGEVQKVTGYTSATGLFTTDAFTVPVATGDNVMIVSAALINSLSIKTRVELALPNAAPDAAGGLPVSDAGGLDLDARLDAAISSRATPAQVATALTNYDAPTRAELTTDKDAIITEVNANETKIDAIKAETALIVADTNELQTDDTPGALAAIDTKIDDIPTVAEFEARSDVAGTAATPAEVATALTNYDPPTKAELDTAMDIIMGPDGDDIKQVILNMAALNNISPAQVAAELATYDGPTKAEMDAGHALLATPAQVNEQVLDVMNVDTYPEPGQDAPPATLSIFGKINRMYKSWRNKKDNDGTTRKLYNDAGDTVDQKSTVSEAAGTVTVGEVVSGP